jgi:hypothetical protein
MEGPRLVPGALAGRATPVSTTTLPASCPHSKRSVDRVLVRSPDPREVLIVNADLREVEEDLRSGEIKSVSAVLALPGAHKGKRRIELASGRGCIAKPKGGMADWEYAAESEVAAWVIARWLNLGGLVPVTVRREIELPTGGSHVFALQLWVEDYEPGGRENFPDEEVRWAAVFDWLTQQGDRDGRNWLVWRDEGGRPHLQLSDNGCAFGGRGWPLRSTLYDEWRGMRLEPAMLAALQRLRGPQFAQELRELLPRELVQALLDRVDQLLAQRQLP